MSTATDGSIDTLADLLERLGHVPLDRVMFHPPPGTATERDLLELGARNGRWCELVDGVLVEKPMGFDESVLACFIIRLLGNFVQPRNLGHVTGEQGSVRLASGLVRIPDAAYFSWDRFPGRRLTGEAVPQVAPDLAVEVLSEANTAAEMKIKLAEYFAAGVLRVWIVDPVARTIANWKSTDDSNLLREHDKLDGGTLLPGFTLALSELFAELDRHG